MASYNRGISTWRSLVTITLAFFAGSIVLSLLPTPETSFTSLADVVQEATDGELNSNRFDTRPVAYFAKKDEKANTDWPMLGGTPSRNNVSDAIGLPSTWNVGEFDDDDNWTGEGSENIKWVAGLGSVTYGNPVVADGKVYVGTNNGRGYIERYPSETDLGCMLCFSEKDGSFLWQHSSEKLDSGQENDWPQQGICSTAFVKGDRMWFVSSRGEVVCCDTEGFHDGENDGPFKAEAVSDKNEADVVWKVDMMAAPLNIWQHNMCSCSVTGVGGILFVNTSNGVDEMNELPRPNAPSFIALDQETGDILWTDKSPGENILHGQWSSPAVGILGGVPQAIFAGGDGWVYSFKADRGNDKGEPELLWKFDANPKTSEWLIGGRGDRNNIIATPVLYNELVYIAVGQDPENGGDAGHLWCIDPTKRGDVSPQLAMKKNGEELVPIEHRRLQAVKEDEGEVAVDNPNTAVVWHYSRFDQDGNGEFDFEEEMHRTLGSVAIKDNILYVADFAGLFHCLDAQTGKVHWTHDMFSASWGSPLIADGKVFIADEDGEISIFKFGDLDSNEPVELMEMGNTVYSTPIIANGVMYISSKSHLFAIETPKKK